jgi:hypothetical protein
MLQLQPFMVCPNCQAEYLPHVRHCSDCGVPLVERLPVRRADSELTRGSGLVLVKEWGVFTIFIPMVLAIMVVFVALRDNPFEVQIASVIGYTGGVFFFVFCDVGPGHAIKGKGSKGFSLGEKAVRQKLPLLVCIHAGSLAVLFAGVTGAIRLRPRAWSLWHMDSENFDLILLFTFVAFAFTQIYFFRRLLERAQMDKQRSGRS